MSNQPALTARVLVVAGLLLAAAGIPIQIAAGVDDYPTIPPGLVLLVVAAAVVWFGARWRWTPLVGVVLAIFLLVGAVVTGTTADRLSEPGQLWPFTGTLIQVIGLVLALLAGLVATLHGYQAGRSVGVERER